MVHSISALGVRNHPVSAAVYACRGRGVVGVRDRRFASAATCSASPLGIGEFRIEVASDPLGEFDVAFGLGGVDRIEEFGVASGAAMSSGGQRPVASISRG